MNAIAITDGAVFLSDRLLPKATILVEGERIAAIQTGQPAPPAARTIDARDCFVTPGLIDVHIHGVNGVDCMSGNVGAISQALVRYGVTGFLATTMPAPWSEMVEVCRSLGQAVGSPQPGARLLGIHLEGPYLSRVKPGVIPPEHFRRPDTRELEHLQQVSHDSIRIMTIAPELPGALEVIRVASQFGIAVSLGHSDAEFETAVAAIRAGARHATHTFNAMRPLRQRDPGIVGAILTDPNVVCEAIGDGEHLHPAVLRLLLLTKGSSGLCLVSDAAPFAGLPTGTYEWAGQTIIVTEASARTRSGTLAGSTKLLDHGIKVMIDAAGAAPLEAVTAATATPARVLGLGEEYGSIAVGMTADIAIFDRNWRCRTTIVGGNVVFERP